MFKMSLAALANVLGINNVTSTQEFHGISIDTRTLQPGNLFIAVAGNRIDSHTLIAEAQHKGAVAALVSRPVQSNLPLLQVENTVTALGKMANYWRELFTIPFFAITGSNGKTTLKNMMASILTAACEGHAEQVLFNKGNLNNEFGLPLTLARLGSQHRYAVLELGMNHFGEIAYLTRIAKPDFAVINNAAAAHLEGVEDLAGVARAKGEIFLGLKETGTAILNHDDNFFAYWRDLVGKRSYLTFGLKPGADVTTTWQETAEAPAISIQTPKGSIDVVLPLLGKHNVCNALAATALAYAANIDPAAIKAGLENLEAEPGRLQIHRLPSQVTLIDDAYNANPVSLQAAIDTLRTFSGTKVLVLGDMRELGEEAKSLHQKAGESMRAAGIDYLFTLGELTANTAQAFGEKAQHFTEHDKLIAALKPFLQSGMTVLVKGSRSMRMDKVVHGLMSTSKESCHDH